MLAKMNTTIIIILKLMQGKVLVSFYTFFVMGTFIQNLYHVEFKCFRKSFFFLVAIIMQKEYIYIYLVYFLIIILLSI